MKNVYKAVLIILCCFALAIGGWLLFSAYGPQLTMEEMLPADPLFFGRLKEPLRHWDSIEKSELFKNLSAIDMPAVLQRNNVPEKDAEGFVKNYQQIVTFMKNPVIGKLLGKEIAFAQYPAEDQRSGFVLVTRSLASIQVAADLSLFFKDIGEDIVVKKDQLNGHAIVHLTFKKKEVSFKYAHIRNVLVFTDEKSTLINDVIATINHKRLSLKNDGLFKEMVARSYPASHGMMFVRLNGAARLGDPLWGAALTKQTGFNAYGLSFLPGEMNKFKTVLLFDAQKTDPAFQKFFACDASNSRGLALIPPSAILSHWGGCYDFKSMSAAFKSKAESVLESQPKKIRKSLQKKLSSDDVGGLFGLLEQEAGGYLTDVDIQGAFPYPRFLLFVRVSDPQKAKALLDGVLNSKQGFSLVATENYQGSDIRYVALPFGGNVDPGFAIRDNYFLLASSRQLIRKSIDTLIDPSSSIMENKQFKAHGLTQGKPNGIFYFKIKEIAQRALGGIEWYDHYLSTQVERASAYKKDAESKKKELAEDIITQKEEIRLAKDKLKELKEKISSGGSLDEAGNDEGAVKNIDDQIALAEQTIKDDAAQLKDIDRVVAKNMLLSQQYRLLMYNMSHVAVPVVKGIGAFNSEGISFSSTPSSLEAELTVN